MFGSPRSGSTWLLQTLSELEAVVPVNESNIAAYLGSFMGDSPLVDPAELDPATFTLRRQQRGLDQHFLAESYRSVWAPILGRLIDERFRALANRYASAVPPRERLVVVKEPNGSQAADLIMEVQPRARLLFLLRDGRDVVDSELAAVMPGSWVSQTFPGFTGVREVDRLEFARRSAYRWLWRTEVVQEAFEAHRGPKLLVRYEELRPNPRSGFLTICRWMGVQHGEDELRGAIDRHAFDRLAEEQTGPLSFHRAANPGLWQRNLLGDEQSIVNDILGEKLLELGYEAARSA